MLAMGTARSRAAGRLAVGLGLGLGLILGAAGAGAQYFGQNKVAGAPREWRVLASAHFDLHFYEEERAAAQEALRVAERVYERLRRVFNHDFEQSVPILLYASQSEFQETRAVSSLLGEGTGGVTEFYKRRVIVPLTGSIAELDHVLSHEIVHAFQVDILARAGRGAGVPALSWLPPLWVMEGLAEYLSVPGVDRHTEMWLRDALLTGELPDIDELGFFADVRVYRYGQSLIAHIAAEFGDEVLGAWFRSLCLRRSLETGTRETLGLTTAKLGESWREALRRRYLPDVARRDRAADGARRLTDAKRGPTFFHVIPAVSPDGRRVAFVAGDGLHSDLYCASALDGRDRRRLIRGYRREQYESLHFYTTSVDWSPDGTRLAFIAKSGGADVLTILDVETRRPAQALRLDFDELRSPVFAPDGATVALVGLRAGRSGLYAVELASGAVRTLIADEWAALQPAWSPDGSRIAFVTDHGYVSSATDPDSSAWRIAVLDVATGAVELLARSPGKSINPQWFPDGRHLLYVSDRDGVADLFVRDLDSGEDYALTRQLTGVSGITASGAAVGLADDGGRLVFSAFEDGSWDLFAIDDPLARLGDRAAWRDEAPRPAAPAGADTLVAADSLAAPLDLGTLYAGTRALPDSVVREERPYRARLSIDYARAGGMYASGFGFLAETGIVLSDMLGDHRLLVSADVSGSIDEGDYAVSYWHEGRRPNYALSLYQYWTGYGYGTYPGFIEEYETRAVRGAGIGLVHPLSRFRRLEVWLDGVYERRYHYTCEVDQSNPRYCDLREESEDAWYAVPEVAWVQDSAIFGSTGPLSGRRGRLSAGATIGGRRSYGCEADQRVYLNIHRRYALALRGVFAGDWGRDATRIVIGGPYSLRGFTDLPLYGKRAAFINMEFRFPFIERLQLAWPLSMMIAGIRGALFFDAGAAWDDAQSFRALRSGRDGGTFHLEDLKAAAGARAAINVGFAVLRWDLVRRTDLSRWLDGAQSEFSIGWEF